MKTIKDDVRRRILDAAREEFLLSGYDHASMRTIAGQAGMTVGNIYLYFTGKEQLFDALVGDVVAQLRQVMQMRSASDENIRWLAGNLHSIFIENRVEFLILITGSTGSRYENFKSMIIDFARRKLPEQFGQGGEGFLSALSVALIEGLLDIFNRYEGDEAQLTRDLILFLNFMLGGLMSRHWGEASACGA